MDYIYFCCKTNEISQKWSTVEIEAFLKKSELFTNDNRGAFSSKKPFLDIILLNVSDYNSWNSEEYDSHETNFISIVTDSSELYADKNANMQIQKVFTGLEELLCTTIQED